MYQTRQQLQTMLDANRQQVTQLSQTNKEISMQNTNLLKIMASYEKKLEKYRHIISMLSQLVHEIAQQDNL